MQTSQISSIEANLFEAIKANDIKAVEELLKKNVPLHSYNEENLTPLMVAAKHGYQEIIKLLVSKGASLYQRSGKINEEYWGQGLTAEKVAQVHRQFQAEDLLNTFAFRYQKGVCHAFFHANSFTAPEFLPLHGCVGGLPSFS